MEGLLIIMHNKTGTASINLTDVMLWRRDWQMNESIGVNNEEGERMKSMKAFNTV